MCLYIQHTFIWKFHMICTYQPPKFEKRPLFKLGIILNDLEANIFSEIKIIVAEGMKQEGIRYHFLSLWNDSPWDWIPASQAIGAHSNHYANRPVQIIIPYKYLFLIWKVCMQLIHHYMQVRVIHRTPFLLEVLFTQPLRSGRIWHKVNF